jgi:hypothetical protein
MSSEATDGQIPDVYGQVHPIETEDLIARKQKEFEDELEKIPESEKQNMLKAQEKCPDLLTDDFKLKFLRCEVFNSDVSQIWIIQGCNVTNRSTSCSCMFFVSLLQSDMFSTGTNVLESLVRRRRFARSHSQKR